MYDESVAGGRRELPISSSAAHTVRASPRSRPNASLASGALRTDDGILSNGEFAFADYPAVNDAQNHYISGNDCPPVDDLSTQRFPLEPTLNFEELFAFEDDTCLSDASLKLYDKLDQQSASWCAWMRRDISLSVVTENPTVEPNSNLLTILQMKRPYAQHSADLVIQSLRSFPTMMLRRETFPSFIHPHSQPLSKPSGAALPEALLTCMSVAQMFASRTSETKYFLWRTIRAECRRIISEVSILFTPCPCAADHHKRCITRPNSNSLPQCKLA